MKEIEKYLKSNKDRSIIILEEVDSTNNYAKKIARQGAGDNTVVIAKSQTNGKGRLGRSFFSPEGTSIYMSVILRPNISSEALSMITPLAAVAVSQAVDGICGTDTKIKWVNDIYLNGRKICGILTECEMNGSSVEFAVLGIGVNVLSTEKIFPDELRKIATSIEDETGGVFSLAQIAAEILNRLDILLPDIEKGRFIEEYRSRSCVIGCEVQVTKRGGRLAEAVGISDNGGLMVRYDDGTEEVLTSGEAVGAPTGRVGAPTGRTRFLA